MQLGSQGAEPFYAFLWQEAESLGQKKNLSRAIFNHVNVVYVSIWWQVKVRINYHNLLSNKLRIGRVRASGSAVPKCQSEYALQLA